MPPKHGPDVKGHPMLPGLELRPGLVHLLTPESADLNPQDFEDITPEISQYADPLLLRQSLIDVERAKDTIGRSVVWFTPAGYAKGQSINIAVSPEDYNGVARDVKRIGEQVVNKTLESYPRDQRSTAEVQGKADRSALHAIEGKLVKQRDRKQELGKRYDLIQSFKEMALPPNRNLNRGKATRERFHTLMDDVVGDMVGAVSNHRKHKEAQSDLMHRSILKRLYIEGTRDDRADYFADLLNLAEEYYGYVNALYATRIYESGRYLRNARAELGL